MFVVIFWRRLLEAVAEDHAIDDVFYALDQALAEERIDHKTFLKFIRKHAAQQFSSRALAQKIYRKQEEEHKNPGVFL